MEDLSQTAMTRDSNENEKDTTDNASAKPRVNGTLTSSSDPESPISQSEEIHYPEGIALLFIVLALTLSMFLIALDLVRYDLPDQSTVF